MRLHVEPPSSVVSTPAPHAQVATYYSTVLLERTIMELYHFGHRILTQHTSQSSASPTHVPIEQAQDIKILWSSWCDVVIAQKDVTNAWIVEYVGTGLTTAQSSFLNTSDDVKNNIDRQGMNICFFGDAMYHGLRGLILPTEYEMSVSGKIVLFATDLEIEAGIADVQCIPLSFRCEVLDIKIASGSDVFISMKTHAAEESKIVHCHDLGELRQCLVADTLPNLTEISSSSTRFLAWRTNATTSTLLDRNGIVYTSTQDPRYPKCLGRSYHDRISFEPVEYLSETRIANIASGGYMSAAISSEGELFLWGQQCPGQAKNLNVLSEKTGLRQDRPLQSSSMIINSADIDQDQLVKCLTAHVNDEEARVYAAAVGHGHIMVATEAPQADGGTHLAVFAAGDNGKHQLGLECCGQYVEEFQEVKVLKGKHIEQLVATGWSTFVVASSR